MNDNQSPAGNDSGEDNQLWQLLQGKQVTRGDEAAKPGQQPVPERRPADPQSLVNDPPVVPSGPRPQPIDKQTDEQRFADSDIPDGFEPEVWQKSSSEKEVSQLQRMLSNPDDIDPGIDFSRDAVLSDARSADYDEAVHDFYRNDQVEVMCRKYPDQVATTQCPECQAFYCQKAMTVRRGRLLCVDCAEAVFVRSEAEILDAVERGETDAGPDIAAPEAPAFEIGNARFGLEGRPAHPLKKLVALLIDFMITRFLLLCVLFLIGGVSASGNPLYAIFNDDSGGTQLSRIVDAFIFLKPIPYWLILFAISDFLYYFLSLAFWNRSIGMSWAGIRVVTEWGEFASFGALLIRTLVFIVLFEAPAVLLSFFFPAFRGLHDYAAGTVVVNYSGVKRVDAYETIQIKLN